jgi:hypothetical protein
MFKALKWPQTHRQMNVEKGSYWTFMNFFESLNVPVVCKTFLQFAYDLYQVSVRQFFHYSEELSAQDRYGYFYPEVFREPEKYIR